MELVTVPIKVKNKETGKMEDHEILQMDNVDIIYRNFKGVGSTYNREGDRNFSVKFDDEKIANQIAELGYNVKIKPPKEEGEMPFMFLPVKIKYNDFKPPKVYLSSGENQRLLDEDTIGLLDNVDIIRVDLDIRPSLWYVNGKSGKAAYVSSMRVVQQLNRFEESMIDVPFDINE